ncbi:hypothetical protein [Saccharicrinis fermentans]|uniref:Uncharacterized protein n=1 Tax=Saccharicrinis fermentans DSM 9555 = JCM 21142 TaxID=869213 RepID=W7YQG9_9BACT|nr:hypothetical protein [Saccharicrinis fermentans]GAF04654.1 hypothetical protein JCM21142_93367 [Saccharicrinis fermentans DSM 9555 = JCM 21142]
MTDKQVLKKKKPGDYVEIANLLGLSRDNVRMILKRPTAKRYNIVMNALRKVVELRESMKEQLKAEMELFQK